MLLDRVRVVPGATDYLELLTQTSYGFVRPSQIGTRAAYVLRTAVADVPHPCTTAHAPLTCKAGQSLRARYFY